MAEYKITLTISETDQKILSNDLINNSNNDGITTWIENALKGKISSCYNYYIRLYSSCISITRNFHYCYR